MVTYNNFIIGLRHYLEEQTGLPAVWRYPGYIAPESKPYYVIEQITNGFSTQTKLKELVHETIFLNVGLFASDVVTHADAYAKLIETLQYHSIPLFDTKGEQIGTFSVSSIDGTTTIPDGTWSEDETNSIRTYTEFRVELDHIKSFL